jgi:hypothetical protein
MQKKTVVLSSLWVASAVAIVLNFMEADRGTVALIHPDKDSPDLSAVRMSVAQSSASGASATESMPQAVAAAQLAPTVEQRDSAADRELAPPQLAQMKQDIAADPHATPASMIRFAQELGGRLEGAMKSEQAARAFVSEMSACVKGNYPSSVQALCLVSVRALADEKPAMKAEYKNVLSMASKQTQVKASWISRR